MSNTLGDDFDEAFNRLVIDVLPAVTIEPPLDRRIVRAAYDALRLSERVLNQRDPLRLHNYSRESAVSTAYYIAQAVLDAVKEHGA